MSRLAGIDFQHINGQTGKFHYPEVMGAGVGLFDYDGDGFLDIYLVQGNLLLEPPKAEYTNRLYHNNGDGTFVDRTAEAGVGDPGFGQGVCAGDVDNDGDVDLFVSNFGPNVFYRNEGNGTFADATAEAGLEDPNWGKNCPDWGQSCSFLDFDNDGYLDLYVQNYLTYYLQLEFEAFIYVGERKVLDYPSPREFLGLPDHLYRNNGDGTFTDVTKSSGFFRPGGKGMGCACFDFDDDGWTDIFVANDSMENYLFRNRGNGTFEEIGLAAGVAFDCTGIAEASMGVDVGDYNGDGHLDLVIPCVWGQVFSLYRNEGAYFTDMSLRTGLAEPTSPSTGFNPNFIDYDNDGDLDIFFSTGGVRMEDISTPEASYKERYGIRDILLSNDGQGRYHDVSRRAGPHFLERTIGRGAAVGDIDNDGDQDIVVSNLAGKAAVLRNDTPTESHWSTLTLVPAKGNSSGLGTSVWCEAGGRRLRSVIHGGVTYLSQGDRRVHFGLGDAGQIDRLEIRWPDGETQTLEDVPADRFLTIHQGREPSFR